MSAESVDDLAVPHDFAARVVAWQRRHGRHGLPWQATRDAYRIWLSEIMLQQTQVSTVLRYYEPFLRRFPTVQHLAAAASDEVMAAWSGLGYYSRARNLHACAQAVVREHGGIFPTQADTLETLPGIGRSTAAAVAAFSSGERRAILDGNVKRVLTRHRAFGQDVARPAALRSLWALAEALLPAQGVEPYTQGLMDLGATVCVLRRPACERCPLQADCMAHAQGRPTAFPVKSRRVVRGRRESVLLVALTGPTESGAAVPAKRAGGSPDAGFVSVLDASFNVVADARVLLQRRPTTGIWAGLWTLPLWDSEAALSQALDRRIQGSSSLEALPVMEHALTHLDWVLRPMRLRVHESDMQRVADAVNFDAGDAQDPPADDGLRWVVLRDALDLGLPAPVRRLLEDLQPR